MRSVWYEDTGQYLMVYVRRFHQRARVAAQRGGAVYHDHRDPPWPAVLQVRAAVILAVRRRGRLRRRRSLDARQYPLDHLLRDLAGGAQCHHRTALVLHNRRCALRPAVLQDREVGVGAVWGEGGVRKAIQI